MARALRFETNEACVAVEGLVLGPIANNTYFIADGEGVMIVDPSSDAKAIVAALGGRSVSAIVLTHRHHDHVDAAAAVREMTGAPVVASAVDAPRISNPRKSDGGFAPCPIDKVVDDGDVLKAGALEWRVLLTPGHTEGSMCLFLDAEKTECPEKPSVLVSGDTLFCGAVGRTDFEGGDMESMRRSLRRLQSLPDETVVLPGHNDLTTIASERRRVFAFYL